ncbi:hypothetical protein JYU34_016322 [Plutella xylostella]|uniref:Uncharacterized protein n=1 Tax=Plutella xylostella TaxID=51655 RepID=A0ABQ7Q629_PLUXY|nr:hypothetical protein JYU34_016322 [Plutella xylostella]
MPHTHPYCRNLPPPTLMSACVMEEGREEGGGGEEGAEDLRPRREVLLSGRGRRACSEQGPHPMLQPLHFK